jgi:DNA-binding FadR family transcriptional regulator
MTKTLRNVLIVLAIAAVVVIVPGGGTGASVVTQAVSLAFLASLVWFASIMYRQHRVSLYSLGEARRTILYVAVAVAALVLTGTHKLWSTSGGEVAWLVLLGAAIYAVFAVVWAARKD